MIIRHCTIVSKPICLLLEYYDNAKCFCYSYIILTPIGFLFQEISVYVTYYWTDLYDRDGSFLAYYVPYMV